MSKKLIELGSRHQQVTIGRARSVLVTGASGFIEGDAEAGLWVYETRVVSSARWLVDGKAPRLITSSPVEQHQWLGYFIALPPGRSPDDDDGQQTLELRIRRSVGEGLLEELALHNYTQTATAFTLRLELEADFDDWAEALGTTRYERRVMRRVDQEGGSSRLVFACHAEHARMDHGENLLRKLDRRLILSVERSSTPAAFDLGGVEFAVDLAPQGTFQATLAFTAAIDATPLPVAALGAGGARRTPDEWERRTAELARTSARLSSVRVDPASSSVLETFERARSDLYSLHLFDMDEASGGVALSAGMPGYVALFGRDALVTSWQGALLDSRFMEGALAALARYVGTRIDDFRDEAPDKIVHEVQLGPLGSLAITPHGRYYGGVSSSLEFPALVASLWHWTGDVALVRRLLPIARGALGWAAKYGDLGGDGFVAYQRRSPRGAKNQGWKDSGDAIVHADGSQVSDPIGTVEMQATLYASKLGFSEVLSDLGDDDGGRQLAREAKELRARFNDTFWMPDEGFFAMGRGPDRRLIRSIASNAGHVLPTGIVDPSLVARVTERLLAADLFSGWGVRTLSAAHPAYDPWSYHRGSVWPAENAMFVYGFSRWGRFDEMHMLGRAQFDAATLFRHHRFPEVFAGHPRDDEHPFPGVYPRANWPQSWSASAIILLLRAFLGVAPYAPLDVVLVDPHLPAWLPDVTLHGLRIGKSVATLRFWRQKSGETDFEVLSVEGPLRVVRSDGALGAQSRGAHVRDRMAGRS
ncbi:MAG TPA: glycogen debranching N-terminal domain-containing protein [Polyangiaceae bacterium]|nr:glycogen debranching N-terminal domain-containing protein [Polyangiaceae bacterium]